MQLDGFCDAAQLAYAGEVYLRAGDQECLVHVSLIMAKTKVAPIKRLTMPRLKLCGAVMVAKLLSHTARMFDIPNNQVYAWSDSNVALSWLRGNPNASKRL